MTSLPWLWIQIHLQWFDHPPYSGPKETESEVDDGEDDGEDLAELAKDDDFQKQRKKRQVYQS